MLLDLGAALLFYTINLGPNHYLSKFVLLSGYVFCWVGSVDAPSIFTHFNLFSFRTKQRLPFAHSFWSSFQITIREVNLWNVLDYSMLDASSHQLCLTRDFIEAIVMSWDYNEYIFTSYPTTVTPNADYLV